MKAIKEIIETPTNFTGSEMTRNLVEREILARWGKSEARRYDPYQNCRTFRQWLVVNRKVRVGEHGIKSVIFIEKKDSQGNVTGRIKRSIVLFFDLQTEPIT